MWPDQSGVSSINRSPLGDFCRLVWFVDVSSASVDQLTSHMVDLKDDRRFCLKGFLWLTRWFFAWKFFSAVVFSTGAKRGPLHSTLPANFYFCPSVCRSVCNAAAFHDGFRRSLPNLTKYFLWVKDLKTQPSGWPLLARKFSETFSFFRLFSRLLKIKVWHSELLCSSLALLGPRSASLGYEW